MGIKTNLSGIITSESEAFSEGLIQKDFKKNGKIFSGKQFSIVAGLCVLFLASGFGSAVFLSRKNVSNDNKTIKTDNCMTEDEFSLQVNSDPKNASVYINNNSTSSYTPANIKGLSDGNYLLQLFLDDRKWEANIEIEKNKLKGINVDIPESAEGKEEPKEEEKITFLAVNTTPSGAKIFFNEEETSKTSPATFVNLDSGTYILEVQRNGYVRWRQSINLKKGDNFQVNALLEEESDDLADFWKELELSEEGSSLDDVVEQDINE